MLENSRGAQGVEVKIAPEAMLVTSNPTALAGSGGSAESEEGLAIQAVSTNGRLNTVVRHSTWTPPGASDYPTVLKTKDEGVDSTLDSVGVTAENADYLMQLSAVSGIATFQRKSNSKTVIIDLTALANNITIDGNGIKILNATSGNYAKISEAGVITVYDSSGAKVLTIDPEALTHDMAIKTWDVCDSGIAKSALVLASDPFA
jgi:hypothetical protein